jgi:hypothetical protein
MNASGRTQSTILLLALIVAGLLVACAGGDAAGPLPTLVATAEPPPPTPVPAEAPGEPLPPAIITMPDDGSSNAAITLPAGDASSQVVIHSGAPGAAIPAEVQWLLDDLASGAVLLNTSPSGPDGQPVNYAYQDINRDGTRDLVVIVVAEAVGQDQAAEADSESLQAIGINLDALVASISADPDAPLVRSAFVYTLSQEELQQLDQK